MGSRQSVNPKPPLVEIREGTNIDGYVIDRHLGEGGMGQVWSAHQPGLGRLVALKVMLPEATQIKGMCHRFVTEAQKIATFDHPGIVRVYDVGELNGCPYYVMEYLQGNDLRTELTNHPDKRLPYDQAVMWMIKVLEAMSYAHAYELVHRDLKPENIFLVKDPLTKTVTPKVIDWGLLKDLAQRELGDQRYTRKETSEASTLGTVHFMSPEQLRSTKTVGPSTDIYAAASILYELVVGHAPYEDPENPDQTDLVIMQQILSSDPPPSAQALRPELPRWLDEVLEKGLAKSVEDRFPTMDAFREALVAGLEEDELRVEAAFGRATIKRPPFRFPRIRMQVWMLFPLVLVFGTAFGLIAKAAYPRTVSRSTVGVSASAQPLPLSVQMPPVAAVVPSTPVVLRVPVPTRPIQVPVAASPPIANEPAVAMNEPDAGPHGRGHHHHHHGDENPLEVNAPPPPVSPPASPDPGCGHMVNGILMPCFHN